MLKKICMKIGSAGLVAARWRCRRDSPRRASARRVRSSPTARARRPAPPCPRMSPTMCSPRSICRRKWWLSTITCSACDGSRSSGRHRSLAQPRRSPGPHLCGSGRHRRIRLDLCGADHAQGGRGFVDAGRSHWWKNTGKKTVVLISADILHDKMDANM